MYGYMGKMVFVNLSKNEIKIKDIPENWLKDFIGGPGLGARILYEYMPAKADVFGPESMIGFIAGPFNNTGVPLGGRYTVVSKSPVYNGWNDANSGGYFGPTLKKAGFDAVFVNGIADKPVYIWIDNGKVEIREASKYWGMTSNAFERELIKDLGDNRIKAAFIGPGGEKKSYMAAVMNDGHRAAGRGGSGAVMGSKKLKAIVCRGNQKVEIADKEGILKLNKEIFKFLKSHPMIPLMKKFGTTGGFIPSLLSGDAGVKNFAISLEESGLTVEDFKEVGAELLNEKFKVDDFGCSACPVRCGAFFDVEHEKYPMKHVSRPEYETIGWFTSSILNTDPVIMIKCNELCNEYGMDTISVGGTVGWVLECFNEGLLTKDQLDGIEPYWGNGDAVVALTEKICKMEGCGEILGYGSQWAANHFGVGHDYLLVSSGIEMAQHDPRRAPGYIRTYQLDPSIGRHPKGGLAKANDRMTWEEKYNFRVTGFQDVSEIANTEYINNSGLCIFSIRMFPEGSIYKFLELVTGIHYSRKDIREMGIRSFTMRHAFNIREGLRRKDFTVTNRMIGKPPMKAGPLKGITLDEVRLGDNLYNALGYNVDGVPSLDMLELVGGLECVIKDLYPSKK
ncbi:aldehyde:ferredoxin oxidoreductase [Pelotomaculum thermopropionicum SI]|uniref:Aldehyde:ferredoxin oxidoreductase n=1 Tax=Pelotomaculum thermopropionicum (strain DSM 13744 / JCM 10971 / SI) TaxID=370438 RepID=A5CZI7_PELTS|nr:aldehyde:ferredoxin oxidoreductase [Pelotomaculum thermopropionicum SI]